MLAPHLIRVTRYLCYCKNVIETDVAHVYPDTNILLHFPAFDGLDWCSLAGRKQVIIHLAQSVIRELNKIKDTGSTKAVRTRAATVQKQLKNLHARGNESQLSPTVALRFEAVTAIVNPAEGFDPAVADDVLVAGVLEFKRQSQADTFIATDDSGLALNVKATEWGIHVLEPPSDQRIPPAPDALERENRDLRARLARIEQAKPDLRLTFNDGRTFYQLRPRSFKSEDSVAKRMLQLHKKYPPLEVSVVSSAELAEIAHLPRNDLTTLSHPITERITERLYAQQRAQEYNQELEVFFRKCEDVLTNNLDIEARSAQLDFRLTNNGCVPAYNPRVRMHFPNGFKLVKQKEIGSLLQRLPCAPHKPGAAIDFLGNLSFRDPLASLVSDFDVGGLRIKESNSYDVTWPLLKLRQGDSADNDPLFLFFDSEPFSFSITFNIVADNHDVVTDELNVIAPEVTA